MKVKIKDVKKIVYSGEGGSGPQPPPPPEIERPPNIEGISDEEENKKKNPSSEGESQEDQKEKESEQDSKKDTSKSEEKLNEDDFEEKPSEGESEDSSDLDDESKNNEKGEKGGEEGGESGEDEGQPGEKGDQEGESDNEQSKGNDSQSGQNSQKGLSKEEAKEILEKIKKELGELDEHIEDPTESPTNIVEAPEDDEDAGSFVPNNSESTNEDQTDTIIEQGKEIQQRSTEKQSGRGTGGGGYSSLGADDVKVTTNWQQTLTDFFQEHVKNIYSYMKPDRRLVQHGIVMRTKRQEVEERLDLVIAVDTSGSISRPLFNTFISEIISIIDSFEKIKFKLLLFHDDVYGEVDVNINPNDQYNFEQEEPKGVEGVDYRLMTDKEDAKNEFRNLFLYQSGGTTLSSVKKYLDKREIEAIDGLLVFTDGDTEQNPDLPVYNNILFMINKGGNTSIVSKIGPVEIVDIPHTSKR